MTDRHPGHPHQSFDRSERRFLLDALRTETVGGAILLVAAAVALLWANLPVSEAYESLRTVVPYDGSLVVGPLDLDLGLDLATWAADGLLAIFFFVVGLELKREVFAGTLRDPARAALPVAAALGGMAVPALVYVAVVAGSGGPGDLDGWGVPVATDIAFALAVLAVLSSHLPIALRVFLLTLAVVDDLLAILIIAVFYTDSLQPLYLLLAIVPLGLFAVLVQRRVTSPYLLLPLALVTWLFVHESGVHATIAGVLLGVVVPVLQPGRPGTCLAQRLEHAWRPVSAGFAIPVFAFFSAGVGLAGGGLVRILTDPVALGIMAGLVIGKPVGVLTASWLLLRFARVRLMPGVSWWDMAGVGFLTGIGFTVSLLIAELAFDSATTIEDARGGVLFGSLIAAGLAAVVLTARNRHHRRLGLDEEDDDKEDVDSAPAEEVRQPGEVPPSP
ncbi:MAG: Na+/H+ antiporter NhaA [Kineosporiaceae bacterium]